MASRTLLLALLLGAAEFDPEEYPFSTVAGAAAQNPCSAKAAYEVKDLVFSAELVYRGRTRPVSGGRRGLLKRWAERVKEPGAARLYDREVLLEEEGRPVWAALPQDLSPHLREEFRPGETGLFYLGLVGCEGGRPAYLLDEFDRPEGQEPDERGEFVT